MIARALLLGGIASPGLSLRQHGSEAFLAGSGAIANMGLLCWATVGILPVNLPLFTSHDVCAITMTTMLSAESDRPRKAKRE